MRVLHVAPSVARAYGGPTQSLVGYVRAGRQVGIEVEIAAPRPPAADEAWLRESIGEVPAHLFPGHGRGAFVASPGLARWLRGRERDYDAVHVHGLWNPVSSLAARGALRRGAVVVIRPFGTLSRYSFAHRRTLLKRVYRAVVDGPNLRAVHALHFTTETERDEAAWHGIDFGGRSWIVPPPAPLSAVPLVRGDDGRGPPVVVTVCRIDPIKNLEALIDAWPAVAAAWPGARLVIAGSGDAGYAATLRARAKARGLGGTVVFAGFVDGGRKAALLASARLFVLPSRHENFGIAVVEALAAGLPVVVSPEVQLAPLVREHGLDAVVAGEAGPLAEAIVRVLGNDAMRASCATRGPALMAGLFSPAAVGAALGAMYAAAAERQHSS